ncbi:hypothetical protein INR49_022967, partial [Caranx melampygus]
MRMTKNMGDKSRKADTRFNLINGGMCSGEEAVSPPLELKIALNKQVLVEGWIDRRVGVWVALD